ncbi:hypothetical protein LNKW23_21980 [Paralimibaculum aggregatum]|uniref:Pentapeptide repeat-containing protein n=1 Tax=Paralimibaculum aggregatum TaxID=3036245 RepID=A0ABQ6LL46_9RHOB|nr:hypothetical protein LNKW23_21980 [Limibaculum sp. NKW23]
MSLDQIKTLAQAARSTWFILLGLLAVMALTLMAHDDADFFAEGRSTRLPLIGLEVPVTAFFFFGPWLVAIVYGYLQLYLVPLWEVLSRAPALTDDGRPIADAAYPWLLVRAVLVLRAWRRGPEALVPDRTGGLTPTRCVSRQAMAGITAAVSLTVTWWIGPLVVLWFWVRGWVVHDPWLSVWAGLALAFAGLVGIYSAAALWGLMASVPEDEARRRRVPRLAQWSAPAAAAAIALMSLEMSVGLGTAIGRLAAPGRPAPDYAGWRRARGPGQAALADWLAHLDRVAVPHFPADLREAWLARPPPGLPIYDDWLRDYETGWMTAAPEGIRDAEQAIMFWDGARTAWFALTARIARHDLGRRDLRGADAPGLIAPAADLRGARLDRAVLRGALLVGADLSCADPGPAPGDERCTALRGADLRDADLVGARLNGARLEGARLGGVDLTGADLSCWRAPDAAGAGEDARFCAVLAGAELDVALLRGTNLRGAVLHGVSAVGARFLEVDLLDADLAGARIEQSDFRFSALDGAVLDAVRAVGADLRWTKLDGARAVAADLRGALLQGSTCRQIRLHGARLEGADLRCHGLVRRGQLAGALGDADTRLPAAFPRLGVTSCWPAGSRWLAAYLAAHGKGGQAAVACPEGTVAFRYRGPVSLWAQIGLRKPWSGR